MIHLKKVNPQTHIYSHTHSNHHLISNYSDYPKHQTNKCYGFCDHSHLHRNMKVADSEPHFDPGDVKCPTLLESIQTCKKQVIRISRWPAPQPRHLPRPHWIPPRPMAALPGCPNAAVPSSHPGVRAPFLAQRLQACDKKYQGWRSSILVVRTI